MNNNPIQQFVDSIITQASLDEIKVPSKFRDQAIKTKQLLNGGDVSGLVNTMLDFAIDCATVDYNIETENDNFTTKLNKWFDNINETLRGRIPTGIEALAKEYFRERWKGSSFLVLRSVWGKKNGFVMPLKLWFVQGEDVLVDDGNSSARILGNEKYKLKLGKNKTKRIPSGKNEKIFVQKPFSPWSAEYPTPFLIQRGLYQNLKFLELLETKGERVVSKAIEYIMLMKKGSETLARERPEWVYDEDDLRAIKEDWENFKKERESKAGTDAYFSNFDTELEHLIPEYDRILDQGIYTPIERRILGGLGLVDILQGIASTRRESTLNPKPFIAEVEQGIKDFKSLMMDVVKTIEKENKKKHPKYFGDKIKIYNPPIKEFITDRIKSQIRGAYDRGVISKKTYIETVGESEYEIERERRQKETNRGDNVVFYPPLTMNVERDITPQETKQNKPDDPSQKDQETVEEDKDGIEKKNYTQSQKELLTLIKLAIEKSTIELEGSPYSDISELPDRVKNNMSKAVQKRFMKIVNNALRQYESETTAFKVAYKALKRIAHKNDNGNWVLDRSSVRLSVSKLMNGLKDKNK